MLALRPSIGADDELWPLSLRMQGQGRYRLPRGLFIPWEGFFRGGGTTVPIQDC